MRETIVADPNGKPENVKIVTVLVTPEESQKLALAMEQGKIQLALRNQGDEQKRLELMKQSRLSRRRIGRPQETVDRISNWLPLRHTNHWLEQTTQIIL